MSLRKLLLTGDEKVDEKTLGGFGGDLAFVGAFITGTNASDDQSETTLVLGMEAAETAVGGENLTAD